MLKSPVPIFSVFLPTLLYDFSTLAALEVMSQQMGGALRAAKDSGPQQLIMDPHLDPSLLT